MLDWTPAPNPLDELARQRRLTQLGVGEGQRHEFLDIVTDLAARAFEAPVAIVTLVEGDRQFFLARHGLEATQTGRRESFCGHCVLAQQPLSVPDARVDPRFRGNPLVVGDPEVRAYLGVPLFAGPAQTGVGTLCVIDHAPRAWSPSQEAFLVRLGSLVESYLEGVAYHRAWNDSPLAQVIVDADGRCLRANPGFERLVGRALPTLIEAPLWSCVLPADRAVLAAMVAHTVERRESPTRRELRFVRLTGEVVVGGTSMSPLAEQAGQVAVVIRDVSLERRATARSGVVAEVHRELGEPLERVRGLLGELRASAEAGARLDPLRLGDVDGLLAELGALIDARIGDIGARVRAEAELGASEQRLRSIVEHVLGPLLVLDARGRIVDANASALAELRWRHDQLVGSSLRVVQPSFTDATCRRWFERAEGRATPDLSAPDDATTFVRRDGSELQVELRMIAMDWNGPGRLVVIAHDVTAAHAREATLQRERDALETQVRTGHEALTELQQMEAALKRSLDEKETLLKEIHHRVKNNLQMVSSLLTLQMDQTPDERTRVLLGESVGRVRSMALIHQHLYGSVSLERVDLGAYARNLAETLRLALAPSARLVLRAAPVEVGVDRAAPVCLILNELLTNAFKYGVAPDAASAGRAGGDVADVEVEVAERARQLRLVVRDRGRGLPEGFDLRGGTSLGLQLVVSLTRQLRGKVTARSDGGAVFELECPI